MCAYCLVRPWIVIFGEHISDKWLSKSAQPRRRNLMGRKDTKRGRKTHIVTPNQKRVCTFSRVYLQRASHEQRPCPGFESRPGTLCWWNPWSSAWILVSVLSVHVCCLCLLSDLCPGMHPVWTDGGPRAPQPKKTSCMFFFHGFDHRSKDIKHHGLLILSKKQVLHPKRPSKMSHKSILFMKFWPFSRAALFRQRFSQKCPWPLAGPSIRLKSSNSSLKSFARLFRCLTTSAFASEELKSIIQSSFRFLSKRPWPVLWFKELPLLSCQWLPWFCRKFQAIL